MVLRPVLLVDIALGTLSHHFQRRVSDRNGQAKAKIQHAALAAVLQPRAGQANVRLLCARGAVGGPPENGVRACANLAFQVAGRFQHLDVGVGAEAGLAEGWEVGGFAAGAVGIGFYGHRHAGGCMKVDAEGRLVLSKSESAGNVGRLKENMALTLQLVMKFADETRWDLGRLGRRCGDGGLTNQRNLATSI